MAAAAAEKEDEAAREAAREKEEEAAREKEEEAAREPDAEAVPNSSERKVLEMLCVALMSKTSAAVLPLASFLWTSAPAATRSLI